MLRSVFLATQNGSVVSGILSTVRFTFGYVRYCIRSILVKVEQYAEEQIHIFIVQITAKTNKRQEQDYTDRINAHLSVFTQHCTSGTKHSAGVVKFVPIPFWNGTWTEQ